MVRDRVRELAEALGVAVPAGAVLSVPMSSPGAAVAAQQTAAERGLYIGCFRPPSVPDGISRLRITANAAIPAHAWARAVATLVDLVEEHR